MKALPYKAKGWKTAPINPVCEHICHSMSGVHFICGQPTQYAYPSAGGGWMPLCGGHGRKHLPHIFTIEDLIASGEVFEGTEWMKNIDEVP